MLAIAKNDIINRLQFDNPWWSQEISAAIQFQDKPRRQYFRSFFAAVTDHSIQRAVVLMGPRRVGKTVMVYHTIRELIDNDVIPDQILYLSLETPLYTGLSLEKLVDYFKEIFNHHRHDNLYIFFDEIQYLKNWEIHLKSLVDSYPEYKFIVTGSAAAALRLKSNESGAGRFSDYILPPLTFFEFINFIGEEKNIITNPDSNKHNSYTTTNIDRLNELFVQYLNFGGYPEAVFSNTIREKPEQYIKSDIIDKVLLRDLPSLYGINDIQELNRLFTMLAYNTGNEISLDNLSKASGVAKNTIRRYMEYLEAAFLIRKVERIDQNAKRFSRAVCFKVYLTNPSMRAALFGQINAESEAMGALTETAIFSQWQHAKQLNLYYARWKSGEVDIVNLQSSTQLPIWAVEIKWSDRPYNFNAELDNCVELVTKNPTIEQPILITSKKISIDNYLYKGINFEFRPSSLYAYTLGANILGYI